ncbi:MAG TPA: hypothetical protein VF622_11925 [Segetibacter sp.]|jgi:hypothetical protein
MQKLTILLFILLTSCNNKGDYKKPENALEAGREFIENSLKGHFNTAKKYMLPDEENVYWLNKVTKDYNKLSEQDKAGLSQASININEVADVSDSVTVINYSNSYKKRSQSVKVVKHKGDWLVDFKYTFSGNL